MSFTPSTGLGLAPKLAAVEMKIASSCQARHMHRSSFGLDRDSTERSSNTQQEEQEKNTGICLLQWVNCSRGSHVGFFQREAIPTLGHERSGDQKKVDEHVMRDLFIRCFCSLGLTQICQPSTRVKEETCHQKNILQGSQKTASFLEIDSHLMLAFCANITWIKAINTFSNACFHACHEK